MNEKLMLYACIMLVSVFISSLSQVLLKKASQKEYESVIKEYLNPMVIGAYFVFFVASILTIIAYRVVPLTMGPILESTSYIYVTIFGVVFFKERITTQKMIALGIIIAGIAVFALLG